MRQILIETLHEQPEWIFLVLVRDSATDETKHNVTLSHKIFNHYSKKNKCTAEQFIKFSFEFLLEKEPKESILSSFDISIISHYYPTFPSTMIHRLKNH